VLHVFGHDAEEVKSTNEIGMAIPLLAAIHIKGKAVTAAPSSCRAGVQPIRSGNRRRTRILPSRAISRRGRAKQDIGSKPFLR
jgi:hypothetical protein